MLSRREFVELSLFVIGGGQFSGPHAPAHVLRVGLIVDSERHDLQRGLSFGAAESTRTALLLGWRIETVSLGLGDLARRRSEVDAVIVGTSSTLATPPPVLRAVVLPNGDDRALTLVPRASTRARIENQLRDTLGRAGDHRIEIWDPKLERFGARQLNDRYRAATGTSMTSEAWVGWLSMKILSESAMRVGSADPVSIDKYLLAPSTRFDGHKGAPLWFDDGGELQQPLYVVGRDPRTMEWAVVREVAPPPRVTR
jgi:hypothetical protein